MVAIVTGTGLGVERGSGFVLGSRGQLGDSAFGRYGEKVTVNAATGNLAIDRVDDVLIGQGIDNVVNRAYNSLGNLVDDNSDNWRVGLAKQITTLTGTVNTSGSTVTRLDWDGSDTLYTYDTTLGCYVCKQGAGAYDTLAFTAGLEDFSDSRWVWTDGDTQMTETYAVATNPHNGSDTYFSRIIAAADTSGNTTGYSWASGDKLSQINTSDGEYTNFVWSGNNLTQVYTTKSDSSTISRVTYTYDGSNRLSTVTTDLTPTNTSDSSAVTTTYTYDSTSTRVATISQTGGAYLSISYDGSHRVSSFTQTLASGLTSTTSFSYSSGATTVTDGLGNAWTLSYDSNGQLTRIDYPTSLYVTFSYNSNGDVLSATDGSGLVTAYTYDANGNMTLSRDPTGVTVSATYSATNQLLTSTRYVTRDPDGSGSGAASSPVTARYAYDAYNNLRFAVSELGEVTEYRYSAGNVTAKIVYRDNTYNISSLAVTDPISESSLASWVSGLSDKSNIERTDTTYDFRGNVATVTSYSKADSSGNGLTTATYTRVTYTYDQFGSLLTRQTSGMSNTEVFTYDGLGRMLTAVDLNGVHTTVTFTDSANTKSVYTTETGLTELSTYNYAGWLTSFQQSASDISTATASYAYDKLGQLRMVTDVLGNKHYTLYDSAGRKTADISPDGELTEYRYDSGDRLQTTIRWATLIGSTALASLVDGSGNPASVAVSAVRPAASTDADNPDYYEWRVYYTGGDQLFLTINSDGDALLTGTDGTEKLYGAHAFASVYSSTAIAGFIATPPTSFSYPSSDLSKDDLHYNYFDADRRVIGTLAYTTGATTQTIYNATGEVAETIAYANAGTYNASFATILSGITTSSQDVHTRYFYDGRGLLQYKLDATLRPTEYVYDAAGHLLHTIEYGAAIGSTSTYTASYVASQISSLSLLGNAETRITWNVYDTATGQLAYTIDPTGAVVANAYDSDGRLIKQTRFATLRSTTSDPSMSDMATWVSSNGGSNDRVSRWFYDSLSRVRYTVDALGGVVKTDYDLANRVTYTTHYVGFYTVTDSTTMSGLATLIGSPSTAVQTLIAYDVDGRVSDIYDGMGVRTKFEYNALDHMVVKREAYGTSDVRVTAYVYDGAGHLKKETDVASGLTSHTYDGMGRLTSTTDRNGNTITFAYDSLSRMTQKVAPTLGSTTVQTNYQYNLFGQLTDVIEAYGTSDAVTTHYTYDILGRVLTETHAYGDSLLASTVTYTYSSRGEVLTRTDQNGYVTSFTHDKDGRNLTAIAPIDGSATATVTTAYNAFGDATSVTDPNGNATTYTYDKLDHVLTKVVPIASGVSATTSYTYNGFGNVSSMTDPNGNTIYYCYDKDNRLIQAVDQLLYITDTTYNAFGEVTQTKLWANPLSSAPALNTFSTVSAAAKDRVTSYTRNSLGRVTTMTDAEGYYETYAYDAEGNRTSVTNKLGGTTTYTFDKRGLVVSEAVSSTSVAPAVTNTYAYDLRGNRTQMVEASGRSEQRTTTYAYDKLDRLTSTTGMTVPIVNSSWLAATSAAPVTTYKYDLAGNLIEQDDAMGARTLFYYDRSNRKTVELSALGIMSKWTYDLNGNVTEQRVYADTFTLPSTPGGTPPSPGSSDYRATTYTYDKANRLLTTTVASIRTYEYGVTAGTPPSADIVLTNTYDAAGNIVRQTDARGNYSWFFYDKRGTKVAQVDQELYLTTYLINAFGQVRVETRYATKLTGAPTIGTLPTGTVDAANDRTTGMQYDRMGRRLFENRGSVAIGTVNSSTGALTTSSVTASIVYTYNALGEVLTKTEATGDVTTYTYDNLGRQITVTTPDFTDAAGATNHTVTTEAYDGLNNLSSSTVTNLTSGSGSHVTSYTYDAGGRIATMTDAAGFVHTYKYDLDGRQMVDQYTRVDSAGTSHTEATLTGYDALGRVVTQKKSTWSGSAWSDGDVVTMTYDAWGELAEKSTNGGAQETFAYDKAGHLYRSTAGDGTVKFYLYDANGDQSATITTDGANPSGRSWSSMTIDNALSDLTGSSTALGSTNVAGYTVTIATFDKRGQQLSTREPYRQLSGDATSGYTTSTIVHSRTYNAFGEVLSETDARGNVTNYTYNTEGKVTQRQLPAVNYTDESGTLHSSVRPTEYTYYDASGRVVATTDANGNTSTRVLLAGTGYGGSDAQMVLEFHPDSGKFADYYDGFGNMTKRSVNGIVNAISGSGEVDETFTYDAMGRLLTETHPTRASGSAGNATGSAQTLVDTYVYDGLGQRIKHYNSFLGSSVIETTDYDLQGRVIGTVDLSGHATSYSYAWSGSAATTGLGTFGGWIKTTVNTAGLTQKQTVDLFGRTVSKTNFYDASVVTSPPVYGYTYDLAGRLINMTNGSVSGQNLAYTYFNTGNMATSVSGYMNGDFHDLDDDTNADLATASYTYDVDGNRLTEKYTKAQWYSTYDYHGGEPIYHKTGYDTTVEEEAVVTWDATNRMLTFTDSGSHGSAPASVTWTYDLAGNIRRMQATYASMNGAGALTTGGGTEDYWYKYDAMNRFTTTMGTIASGVIGHGTTGSDITYNADGSRATMTDNISSEAYTYSTDGLLAQVSIGGTTRAIYSYDTLGRVSEYTEKDSGGSTVYHRYSIGYANNNLLTGDTTATTRSGTTTTQVSTYSYVGQGTYNSTTHDWNYDGGYQGVTTRVQTATTVSGTTTNSETENWYFWADNALQSSTKYIPNVTSYGTYNTSTFNYDLNNHLEQVQIADGHARNVNFITDASGQVLRRDEVATGGSSPPSGYTPHELHYFFNGIQIGDVSNNGTSDTDYAASIAAHTATAGSGWFRAGQNYSLSLSYGNFDQSYSPINGNSYGSTASSYTAADGDTLQSIAQMMWGDSSLWYLIADANGMGSGSAIAAGTTLLIPNKVANVHNNATTFKPYDPNEAIGDVAPTVPKGKNNCGVFGQILLSIIAIAVSLLTLNPLVTYFGGLLGSTTAGAIVGGAVAAAAGSIVSQGVGVATGIQKSFNWGAVGLAAIGGAVGGAMGPGGLFGENGAFGGLTGIKFVDAALRGAASNALSQGIGVATGLQKKFDWAGVAAAGVGAGVAQIVSDALPGAAHAELNVSRSTGASIVTQVGATSFNSAVSGFAGMIASAATRSLVNGSDFGDNVIAALPDAIGNVIGSQIANAIGNAIARQQQTDDAVSAIQQAVLDKKLAPDTGQELIKLVRNGQIWGGGSALNPTVNPKYDPNNALEKSVYDQVIAEWGNSPNSVAQATQAAVVAQMKAAYDGLVNVALTDPAAIGSDLANAVLRTRMTFNTMFASYSAYFYKDIPQLDPQGYKRIEYDDAADLAKMSLRRNDLEDADNDYHAYVFVHGNVGDRNASYIVANRGTEHVDDLTSPNMVSNELQNAGMESDDYDDAMSLAVKIAFGVGNADRTNIVFTGHSMGGGEASAQAVATGYKAIVFDPPGLNRNTAARFMGSTDMYRNFESITNHLITAYVEPGNWLDDLQRFGPVLDPVGDVVRLDPGTAWSGTAHDTIMDAHGMDFMTYAVTSNLMGSPVVDKVLDYSKYLKGR